MKFLAYFLIAWVRGLLPIYGMHRKANVSVRYQGYKNVKEFCSYGYLPIAFKIENRQVSAYYRQESS